MRKLALTIAVLLLAGLSTRPVAAQSITINGTTYQLPLTIVVNAAGSPTPTTTSTPTATATDTATPTVTPTVTPLPIIFTITNPGPNQTVSGLITVSLNIFTPGSCADPRTVWWTSAQIDGVNRGSGYTSIPLDVSKVTPGPHTLTVNAWNCAPVGGKSAIIGTQSVSINVVAPSPTPTAVPSPLVTITPTHFMTLPPNSPLPSGQSCAAIVKANPLSERIAANQNDGTGRNSNVPPTAIPSYFYTWAGVGEFNNAGADFAGVDGNFTGSTEDIFRWAACKWGVDEELVRDQAWQESFWRQAQVGDIDSPPGCNTGLPITLITPGGKFCALLDLANADAGFVGTNNPTGHQWDSWGVLQTKAYYAWPTWPMIKDSTSFGTDYRYAEMRGCMNGDQIGYYQSQTPNNNADYLAAVAAAQSNPSGASPNAGQTNLQRLAYGCVETHYSGSWNKGLDPFDYLTPVLSYATSKPWLKAAGQRKYNLKPRPDPHRAMIERMFKLHQPRRRK